MTACETSLENLTRMVNSRSHLSFSFALVLLFRYDPNCNKRPITCVDNKIYVNIGKGHLIVPSVLNVLLSKITDYRLK